MATSKLPSARAISENPFFFFHARCHFLSLFVTFLGGWKLDQSMMPRAIVCVVLFAVACGVARAAVQAQLSSDVSPGDYLIEHIKAARQTIKAAVYKFG